MIVACSLERRWIAEGTRHRPERLAWNNVDSHWPVCVDWTGGAFVRAQSLRSCQMNKCHFTIIMSCVQSTLRNIRQIFGQIRLSGKLNYCHFTSLHDYHVVCSIHTSQHSVNIRTNSAFGKIEYGCHFTSLHDYHVVCSIRTSEHSVNFWTNSVFGKIRPSDNCRFRTYVILHCLNQIGIFIILWLRHVFTIKFVFIRYTKIFQNILRSALWFVIPAKTMSPAA